MMRATTRFVSSVQELKGAQLYLHRIVASVLLHLPLVSFLYSYSNPDPL